MLHLVLKSDNACAHVLACVCVFVRFIGGGSWNQSLEANEEKADILHKRKLEARGVLPDAEHFANVSASSHLRRFRDGEYCIIFFVRVSEHFFFVSHDTRISSLPYFLGTTPSSQGINPSLPWYPICFVFGFRGLDQDQHYRTASTVVKHTQPYEIFLPTHVRPHGAVPTAGIRLM